jgi:tetratricopeptide (TPR) repeat protein
LNPNFAAAHAVTGLAKFYEGHPEETERHELEALRVSPRDTDANLWAGWMAHAKLYFGAYEDALNLDPNYPVGRLHLAATLVELGRLDEARAEVKAALALDPNFTPRRYRDAAPSDNPNT